MEFEVNAEDLLAGNGQAGMKVKQSPQPESKGKEIRAKRSGFA
jgi:hypothetical protein